MTTGQVVGLAAGLLSAAFFGVGAVAQAHAVRRQQTSPDNLFLFLARSLRDSWTMLVVLTYLAGFVLHAVAIWLLPLYLAQAAVAMSLPVTAMTAGRVNERLTRAHWSAIAAVIIALVLLAIGSGQAGSLLTSTQFAVVLWSGIVVLAGLSWWRRHLGGSALGALAGLGYSGSAVAVRGVGAPLETAVVLSALAVPVYSLIAFWLYSLAMNRAAVSSATAPLIVAQTFVPAAVGVLFLNDGVRPGWWPAVVGGLLLASAGAIRLSREDVRSPVSSATGSSPGLAPRSGR